jgi:hypothetical protein
MIRGIRFIVLLALLQLSADSCNEGEPGCTDPQASNYDPAAVTNDGSCKYDPATLSPVVTLQLDEEISGTSGLILWDGNLWTHNDYGSTDLYGLDTASGEIERIYSLEGAENLNWEEIAQDQDDIYIGAFGNNATGNRTDLHILKVSKSSLKSGNPHIDTIWFSYADQVDLSPRPANQTDFDCEAFIVTDDSIYLFTKQWISAHTTLYRLPKIPGRYEALKISSHPVEGMVTGSTWIEPERLVVLCGYTILLQPFLYLLYDFSGTDFFSANIRRVDILLPFHQVEGIATGNGLKFYVSNESFEIQSIAKYPQKLHTFDLTGLLGGYIGPE